MMHFSTIIGHDALKPRLLKLVGVSHAYMFSGPPSIGKRTIASVLARYLLCQGTKEDECTCKSCLNFSQGHPDLLCIGREGKVLVGDIEDLIGFVVRAPLCSDSKVVIIDNADVISYEASNRLLKILEESSVTFFLITSRIKFILPTIRSRCVKIQFNSLSQDDITNILWKKMGFELVPARILGWIGAGSSMDIFSNAGLFLKYRDMSFEFINLLSSSDFINVLDFIDRVPREDLTLFNDMVVLTLTDLLLLSYSVEAIINSDRRQDLQKMVKENSPQMLIIILNILSQVKRNNYLNINFSMALKAAMMKVWGIVKAKN
jgi:DNA polymerase-3 subunit delta'